MKDAKMADRRALVTGASGGIGAELARVLASEGCDLVLVARRRDRLEALADELRDDAKVEVDVLVADLGDPQAPARLLEQTEGAGRPIDVLVNNAGIASYEDFLDLSWGQVAAQIQLNVTAVTELCHRFAPRMVERGRGHILNIASIAAYAPTPGYCVYGPTKAFVRNMTETLDFELRGTGVRATCVNPGGVRTEFLDKLGQVPTSRGQALLMPADRCARLAVDAMLAGRRNTITGWSNALGMWLLRLLPRAWYPTLAKFSMDLAVTKQR